MNRTILCPKRHAAALTVFAALLFSVPASAQVSVGSFMANGANTSDTGTGTGYCIQRASDGYHVAIEKCVTPVIEAQGQWGANPQWFTSAQEFQFVRHNSDNYGTLQLIVNGQVQGCLDILGNNPANYPLDIATCNGTDAQNWTFYDGVIQAYNHSGYCVDLYQDNTSSGTQVGIYPCNGNWSQNWLPANFTVNLRSRINTNQCLDVWENDQADNTEIDAWTCNGGTNQWFVFEPTYGGYPNYPPAQYFHSWMFSTDSNGHIAMTCGEGGVGSEPCLINSCGNNAEGYCGFNLPTSIKDWFYYDGDLTTYFEYSIDHTLTNALYSSANFGEYGVLTATSSLGNQIYNDPLDAFNLSSGMEWDMTIVAVP